MSKGSPKGFPAHRVAKWLGGAVQQGSANMFREISTDTRTLSKGALFFALAGPRRDGHAFLREAIDRKCAGVVIRKAPPTFVKSADIWCFRVPDTYAALKECAKSHLRTQKTQVIAITGSTGKSTTKELVGSLLSTTYPIVRSEGSYNNELGVPLTLLKLRGEKFLVQEMAMRRRGDIAALCHIAPPDYGIITRIGTAHLGVAGSQEAILKGKGELLQALSRRRRALLNSDDPHTAELAPLAQDPIFFGLFSPAEFQLRNLRLLPEKGWKATFVHRKQRLPLTIPLLGKEMLYNVLSALSLATLLGVSPSALQKGLRRYRPLPGRLELKRGERGTILYDAYNANPESVEQALWTLAHQTRGERKVALLGTMLELGAESRAAHYRMGAYAAHLPIDLLIAVGEESDALLQGFRDTLAGMASTAKSHPRRSSLSYQAPQKALPYLLRNLRSNDVLLLKASRALQLEKLLPPLLKQR